MGTLVNNATFHQGLHCFLRSKETPWIEIHHNLEIPKCDPLMCKISHLKFRSEFFY